jgi:hypothetical protein
MTDEELIAWLRGWGIHSADNAANRIEQLIEGSKGLAEAFATVSVKREMTEAKLTKAVHLIGLSVELARWDLNPKLRDDMIDFTTQNKLEAKP